MPHGTKGTNQMSLYKPKYRDPKTGEIKESKGFWMEFHFDGQRIRESTGMPSITRAKEVQKKRQRGLEDGSQGLRKREKARLFVTAAAEWMEAKKLKWSPRTAGLAEGSIKRLAAAFGQKVGTYTQAR